MIYALGFVEASEGLTCGKEKGFKKRRRGRRGTHVRLRVQMYYYTYSTVFGHLVTTRSSC